MAEVVQGILEDMTSDLIDLQTREVFSESEIKQIVEARRNHEYKLMRNKPTKKHFLAAISYEIDLEEQRVLRKQDLTLKPAPSDKSITRRILSLFRRFSRSHKADVSVWKEYINFCVRSNSKRELAHVLGKCLELHSRSEELWLIGKCIEVNINKNVDSGRNVLQRAIELNPTSKTLWTEYFKFEAEHSQNPETLLLIYTHAVSSIPSLSTPLLKLSKSLNLPLQIQNNVNKS